jgi:curved DNA-binding protein CbpA
MSAEPNLYRLLQVHRDSDDTVIRYAYRFLAAQYHPDNPDSGDKAKFERVTQAWKVMSDQGRRAEYDRSLREGGQENESLYVDLDDS